MSNVTVEFLLKDQNHLSAQSVYWFRILTSESSRIEVGETYGVVVSHNQALGSQTFDQIVDEDGCPVIKEEREELSGVLNQQPFGVLSGIKMVTAKKIIMASKARRKNKMCSEIGAGDSWLTFTSKLLKNWEDRPASDKANKLLIELTKEFK